jgi:hypothetical protein
MPSYRYTVIGSNAKGRQQVLHVTAVGFDDVEGFATHVRDFKSYVILEGHLPALNDDDVEIETVDMTAPGFSL